MVRDLSPGPGSEDAQEALADKLRSGEYGDVVTTAQKAAEAQLCLQSGGGITKADPYTAFAGLAQAQAPLEDPDDELRRIREARKAQLRDEHAWRRQGHGQLRELANEREFIEAIKPHERAVVLLDDGRSAAADDVNCALTKIAKAHLEAQFCRLSADRAFFLTQMVELEGLPTLFLLRNGEVTGHLPPSRLFEYSSASSPLFGGHLVRLLHRAGVLMDTDGGSDSEDEDDDRR
eukprot:CAMPEP_0113818336 /NCGR_PEP_ID=MMETSP0328-20130328/189_1 /TAXON_ID=39455 /ORGANISM="Alexandrium minutum" /LENGTH=233 /DNA_ID=CAMNT_0000786271 /DNA_START=65 /DNA_END=766 /DNA_ORIENTATION=+ /assembly_acc=CAM_ASM_000350